MRYCLIALSVLLFVAAAVFFGQTIGKNMNAPFRDRQKEISITKDSAKYYYNGEINIQLIQENNKFYRIEYYDSGEIKTRSEIELIIVKNTSYSFESLEKTEPFKTIESLIQPRLNGKTIEYYKNGSVKADGFYKWGKKDKSWKYYNEEQKLIRTEKWHKGVISR
jgi:antitoxin component YwqK of YwqJK toxin-antitoxin module